MQICSVYAAWPNRQQAVEACRQMVPSRAYERADLLTPDVDQQVVDDVVLEADDAVQHTHLQAPHTIQICASM